LSFLSFEDKMKKIKSEDGSRRQQAPHSVATALHKVGALGKATARNIDAF
jgi:hypothetical protein